MCLAGVCKVVIDVCLSVSLCPLYAVAVPAKCEAWAPAAEYI